MFNKHRSKRVLYVRILTPVLLAVFAVISILATTVFLPAKVANAASNTTINFQARLLTSSGGIVPDGTYNVEFKLYNASTSSGSSQGSCTGDANCLWTETRTTTNRVTVKAGYLTVALGSVTAFPTTINWDQNLWLTMNIGGTGTSPTWDGEMSPRLAVTSVPYAFRAGELASLAGSNEATLQFAASFGQATNITLPDPGAASATVCYQSATACGFALGSGTAFLQGGNSFGAAANLGTNDANVLNFRTNNATRLTLDTSGNLTFAQASTLSTSTGNLTVEANGTNTLDLDTTGLGTVSIANNASVLDLEADNSASTIHIGDGGTSTTQTITIGSVGGSSATTVTGGSGGVSLTTGTTTGNINLTTNNASSGVIVKSSANANNTLQVQNSVGADVLNIDASGDQETIGYVNDPSGGIGQFGNLIANSQTIGGTGWSLANAETAVQAATTAPDGTTTASKILNGGTANGAVGVTITNSSVITPYTFSFWAKSGNSTKISCLIYDNTASAAVGSLNTFTLTSSWQRYTCTGTPATTGHQLTGYIYADGSTSTTSGNYNYVWGAQAVLASVAEPYVATFGTAVAAGTGIVSEGTTLTSTGLIFSGASPTISASTSNTSLSINSNGTGTLILGNNQASDTVQVGNTSGAYAQTINIGNTDTTAGSSSAIILGSTIGGNITLQSAGTIAIGNNSAAQTLNIGNTTGATALNLSVGTGNFSLSGVAGSTFTIGTGTTTGSIGIGAALTTGSVTIGSTSASGTSTVLQAGATNQTLRTAGDTISTSTNSTTALVLQNASNKSVITGDTSNGQLILGNSSTGGVNGTLVFDNTTNTNTVTLVTGVTSATYSLTLPTTAPGTSQCLQSGSSIATQLTFGSCATGSAGINNSTSTQSANFNVQAATSGTVAGTLEANASGSGDVLDLLNGSGVKVLTVGSTGNVLSEASTNSSTAFQIQNASGSDLLNVNTTGSSINVNALSVPGTVTASLAPVAPVLTKTGTGTATYAYEVVGVDANGAKTMPSPASTTSTSAPNTLATGGSAQESLNITSTGATSYLIYRTTDTAATAGTGSATLGLIGSTTSTGAAAFIDTGKYASQAVPTSPGSLTNGTTYYFKVTALDGTGGQTTASGEVSKTASTVTSDAITLSWAPVTGARSYNVYYEVGGSGGAEANYFNTGTNNYTLTTTTGNTAGSVPTTNTGYDNTLSSTSNSQLTLGNTTGSASSAQLDVAGSVPSAAIGSISFAASSSPRSEFVQGNYAYVTSFSANTLNIIDISNPAHPVQVNGTGTATNTGPRAVYVSGNYAYIDDETANTLQVFDISNPANPVSIASISTGSGTNPLGLYVQGRYAYVTDDALSEMQIFDISTPANPSMVSSITLSATLTNPDRVYVQGKFAYVAFNGASTAGGFQIIDVSNPASPFIDSTTVTASGTAPSGPYVQGDYLYFLDTGATSLQIYNIANPLNPVAVNGAGTTLAAANPFALSIQGHYAYVTEVPSSGSSLLQVIDISNPASPVSIGTVVTGTSLTTWSDLKVQGRYAYVTTTNGSSTNTLQIYDLGGAYIQDIQGGSAEFAGLEVDSNALINGDENIGGGLSVSGSSQLYGDLGVSGNLTVTGSTPSAAIASIATGTNPGSVAVEGSYAYVLNYTTSTMSVVDIADPHNVFVEGTVATSTNPTNIYVSGNYAYVPASGGYGVGVFNLDNPYAPVQVGWLDTGAGPDTVYVSGNYVYVTDQGSSTTNSLQIYSLGNLSYDTAPVGNIEVGAGLYPQAVAVDNNYAYVTNHGGDGLEVFDVSHPSLPFIVYTSGASNMSSIYIRGDFAYIIDDVDDLLETEYIGNPLAPFVANTIGTAGAPTDVYIQGNYAYVSESGGPDEMQTFNIASDSGISLAGSTPGNNADSIWVQGNYAYLADTSTGNLDVFNVGGAYIQQLQVGGTQTDTLEVGSDATISGSESVAGGLSVSGSTLLSGTLGADGQLSVNSSNQNVPIGQIGTGTGSNPAGTFVSGNYTYVVNSIAAGALQIYNTSNPTNPVLVGSIATGASSLPFGVYVSGNYAYVTDSGTNVLAIYNISNPSVPVLAGSITTGANSQPYDVYVSGNYAYVTDVNTSALAIYNVSNPAGPVLAGSIATGANPEGIYVSGSYAYVADYSSSSATDYNISNPANPVLASTVTVAGNPTALYAVDGYVYVVGTNYSSNTGFLDIINSANPASLVDINSAPVGVTGAAAFSTAISVSGNYAYVDGYNVYPNVDGYINTYNITDPYNVALVNFTDIGQYQQPDGLAVQGRYAFVADQGAELYVYDLGSAYIQQLQAGTTETGTLQVNGDSNLNGNVTLQGGLSISQNIESSGNLGVAGGSTFQGSVVVSGGANILATPTAPTVTPTGTAGSTAYSYTITAINASGGETLASPVGSTATGNATLSGTNYNALSWAAVSGATGYKIYRTVGGGSTGLVGSSTTTTFNDTGIGGGGTAAPTINTTAQLTTLGSAVFQSTTNSSTAFQVQNAQGIPIFLVDTTGQNAAGAQVNYLSNPGFETGTSTWTASGSATISQNTVKADTYNGLYSLKVVGTATGAGALTTGFVSAPAAGTYTVSFYVLPNSAINANTYTITLTGSSTSGTCTPASQVLSTAGFMRVSCTTTAFSGTLTNLKITNSTASLTTYMDAIQLSTSAIGLQPYQEGAIQLRGVITNPLAIENNANSTSALTVYNAAGVQALNVDTVDGEVTIGSGNVSEATGQLLIVDSDNNATYNAGTATNASTEVNGAMFYSSTNNSFLCGVAGSWETCNGLLYSNTAVGSAVNTCLTTACGALASAPIPANYCQAGRIIHVFASGLFSTTGAPTLGMSVRYGTSATQTSDTQIGGAATPLATTSGSAGLGWHVDFYIDCFSTTSMDGQGYFSFVLTTTTSTNIGMYNSGGTTVTTTSAANLYLFPNWSVSSASNTIAVQQFIVTGN